MFYFEFVIVSYVRVSAVSLSDVSSSRLPVRPILMSHFRRHNLGNVENFATLRLLILRIVDWFGF